MRNLTEFLARYHHWFLFLLLEVAGLVLLFKYNSYQGSAWFSTANAVMGKVYEWDSEVQTYFSLVEVNRELTQRNIYLEKQVETLGNQLTTATRDSNWVRRGQLALLDSYKLIPAKVVSNTVDKHDNFLTIDKGRADGVRDGMGGLGYGCCRYCLPCLRALCRGDTDSQLEVEHQLLIAGTWLFRLPALDRRRYQKGVA